MALSALEDRSHPPEPGELEAVLGKSAELWQQLIAHVGAAYPPMTELWSFTAAKYGWSLRLRRKERVLLYLTPQTDQFLLGVVLGEKAAKAAHDAGAPEAVLALIDSAPRYAEGRGIRMPIKTRADLEVAQALTALKVGP
jgi:hypothetical protein